MNQVPRASEEIAESLEMRDIRVILVPLDIVGLLERQAFLEHQGNLENRAQKEKWELRA